MPTFTNTSAPDTTSWATYKSWTTNFGLLMAQGGLVQDTSPGQVTWNATVFTFDSVAVTGGSAAYHWTSYTGPTPRVGMCIVPSGFAASTGANNAVTTLTITTVATTNGAQNALGTCVYTYSSYTGPAPAVGMIITITGFSTGSNNVTGAQVKAITGGASGQITVETSTQTTAGGQSGTATGVCGLIVTGIDLGAQTVTFATTVQVNETHAGSGTTTAVTTLAASYGNVGMEIWRFPDSDANQATCPVYIQIYYGTVSTAQPAVMFRVCTALTNGIPSATQTGPLLQATTASSTTQATNFLFYGTGRFGLFSNSSISNIANLLVVERSLSDVGAYTDEYVAVFQGCGTVYKTTTLPKPPGTAGFIYNCITAISVSSQATAFGSSAFVSPVFPILGAARNPFTNVLSGQSPDFGEGALISVSMYGSSHVYLFSKLSGIAINFNAFGSGSSGGLFMRWD